MTNAGRFDIDARFARLWLAVGLAVALGGAALVLELARKDPEAPAWRTSAAAASPEPSPRLTLQEIRAADKARERADSVETEERRRRLESDIDAIERERREEAERRERAIRRAEGR